MIRGAVAVAVGLAGCGGSPSAPEPGAPPVASPGPSAPLLEEGQEVMARYDGHETAIVLWPEVGDVVAIPQGATLRVVKDPGPESDPEREIVVYAIAKDVAGKVGRDEVRSLDGPAR